MGFFLLKRRCIFLALVALVNFFFQSSVSAKELILSRTGTISVATPDGIVLEIEPNQVLPDIPSGSKIEVLNGSIDIEPSEGFIQVVVGGSVATVKAGDKVTASIDPATKMGNFKVSAGQINIITGNTITAVQANQEVQIGLDKKTGRIEIKSIKGNIETTTIGVKVTVRQGADAIIKVNPNTRKVYVESVDGEVTVVTLDGESVTLTKEETTEIEGSAEGEIQTFGEETTPVFIPEEEPAEPERPEASPHRP
jgi:uncharacterized cupin superfamily protein